MSMFTYDACVGDECVEIHANSFDNAVEMAVIVFDDVHPGDIDVTFRELPLAA